MMFPLVLEKKVGNCFSQIDKKCFAIDWLQGQKHNDIKDIGLVQNLISKAFTLP